MNIDLPDGTYTIGDAKQILPKEIYDKLDNDNHHILIYNDNPICAFQVGNGVYNSLIYYPTLTQNHFIDSNKLVVVNSSLCIENTEPTITIKDGTLNFNNNSGYLVILWSGNGLEMSLNDNYE